MDDLRPVRNISVTASPISSMYGSPKAKATPFTIEIADTSLMDSALKQS